MPATKKPADRLQRRNKPKAADAQVVALNTATIPEPPTVSGSLRSEWELLWSSELAAHWNQDSDLPAIRRLFKLYDRLESYERIGDLDPLTEGSTKQVSLHPMLKAADSIRSQILALEDRFGLTPMARLKLGIALGEASSSLEEMNKRAVAAEADTDDFDPRITAIETNLA